MCTAWTMMCVCIASRPHIADVDSVRQLLALVPQPVKAVILLFPIRDKLEELRQAEETQIKEKGQVPIDPTVFWIKQTVRPIRLLLVKPYVFERVCEGRSETRAARLVCCTP